MSKILQKLNKITQAVKEEGRISFGQLCVKCDIAPSTLYGYIPMLVEMFEWIEYRDKEFVRV